MFDTFQAWQEKHPEFLESVKRGQVLSQSWWEREGRKSLRDGDFSYTGWYMNMKNRFAWRDQPKEDKSDGDAVKLAATIKATLDEMENRTFRNKNADSHDDSLD